MLVGRAGELAKIDACAATAAADAVRQSPPAAAVTGSGCVVEFVGAAGIGKSALLAAAVERLTGSGFAVISHGTTAPERSLSWATLITVLEQLDAADHQALATTSRRHLDAVLHPDPADDPRPHGVALATSELIGHATRRQPLAIIIDDAHWVDAPSAAVLTFTARLLAEQRALLVLARDADEAPTITPSPVAAHRWHRIDVGGLPVDAVAELVRTTTGERLHRSLLLDVCERSGGHPQLVIEIAGELVAGVDRKHALRPRVVSDVPAAQLAALPEPTRGALEHTVLMPSPTVRALATATGDDDVLVTLEPAETSGLVVLTPVDDDIQVRFDPPLVAAAVEQQMSTARRRAVHASLAAIADEPIQRAVHLAVASFAPDASVAAEIERGAALALRRGDPRTATSLGEAAVAATPPDDLDGRRRRLLALAEAQSQDRRAADVLATLARVDAAPRSEDASRVALLRTPALAEVSGLDAATAVALDASAWIEGPRRAVVFRQLNAMNRMRDLRLGAETARRARQAAHADGSPEWIATATVAEMAGRAATGEEVDIDAAVAVASSPAADEHTRNELLHLMWYTGDPRGVEWTERVVADAGAAGDAVYELNAHVIQANLLIPRGDWQRAEDATWQALRHGYPDATERALLGFVRAATGQAEQADVIWSELVDAGATRGRANTVQVEVWRALAAWASGADDAADRLLRADELVQTIGFAAPRGVAFRRDAVEALVTAGRVDEARPIAERLRAAAGRNQLANAIADADVAEAVIAAVDGDDGRAAALMAGAIMVYERYGERYELARALLTAGRLARHTGRRAEARRDLDAARALFDGFGATPWAARATAELGMIGGRPRRSAALTESERQIAEHAVAGKSNAEIAAALFVARRTVEANLSRVYRKLGIRGRAQLADALRGRAAP